MSVGFFRLLAATSALALCLAEAQAQAPLPRQTPAAGSIVAAKGGEEMRFVREDLWRAAQLQQSLVGGDTLRTNAIGNLAILFKDQTQIRVGRNSTLTVNEVADGPTDATQLSLQGGNIWARAARGGSCVDVKTPAAVAAIRGTDWSLAVDGSGKTSLVVLEGVVELKNPQGAVTVRQGEGAVAAIGQAPTKFVLVSPNDREQMLFYMSMREVFINLPTSTLEPKQFEAEDTRIQALAPEARTTEDWLTLAESLMNSKGRQAAAAPLAEARGRPMTRAQRARADYLEALIAGADRRWQDAIKLFERAKPGLDSRRRGWAEYGRYAAASLADPKRVQPAPKVPIKDPRTAEINAYLTGFREDLKAAAAEAAAAGKQFPKDAGLAILSASLAQDLDHRKDMYAAYERARAIDPTDPNVIAFGATIKADYARDIDGALADLYKVVKTDPNFSLLNQIGLLEQGRGAFIEAEAAFRRAIEIEPQNPIPYTNLAILLLDQSRVEEAGALIDKALALDPPTAYSARGRYLLQKGKMAQAIESLLAGSAVNPALSNDQVTLADAYFQNGDYELAWQTLDNADRLDPRAPIVPILRTAFALDLYLADEAILAAREALRRYRARGGDYAGISVTKQTGSYPVEAYRFINMHEWARFYADRTFDPFEAQGYFDQAILSRPGLFPTEPTLSAAEGTDLNSAALNLSIQGLLLDPLAVSGRIGRFDPIRRPFLDTEIGGGAIVRGGKVGWESGVLVNGFSNEPLPTSFSLSASANEARGNLTADNERGRGITLSIGTAPNAADRFMFMGWAIEAQPGLTDIDRFDRTEQIERDETTLFGVAGWSHTFAYRNVLSAAVFATRNDTLDRGELWDFSAFPTINTLWQEKQRVDGVVGAVSHAIGIGDFNLRYGLEAQAGQLRYKGFSHSRDIYFGGYEEYRQDSAAFDSPFRGGRAYADLSWRPNDWFEAQAGIHRTFLDVKNARPDVWVAPRFGIGVSPLEGQWLRAAYVENADTYLSYSLGPATTVGLIPNDTPASGPTKSLILRWDAEWTPHVFTALEYQRQTLNDLNIPRINTLSSIEGIEEARAEWIAATVNVWLGHGIGVFGTVGGATSKILATSEDLEGRGVGEPVPYIPERFARLGFTFVHPSRLRFTVTQNFIGERSGNYDNDRLESFWTTDAAITWETPDRRFQVGLTALNLFDQSYDFGFDIPAPGRTVAATVKARF
ncbi:FecR domain-containing protein [Microvirga sp. VF16]|uniref:FecR domain-containing protein n=1 Tax=Microvirga sp. VF16 TaxID=2807101 RepID=UPI00193E2E68|nr:FecR domain-containing protein [Microvirga sp. VF16]QRM29786.1 FecR domain-containing protein [Microvirga sp. VF16]